MSSDSVAVPKEQREKEADVVLEGTLVSNGGVDERGVRKLYAVVKVSKVIGAKAKGFAPGDYTFEAKCTFDACPNGGLPGVFGDNPGTELRLLLKTGKSGELTWVKSEEPQRWFATGRAGKNLPKGFKDGLTQLAPLPEPAAAPAKTK